MNDVVFYEQPSKYIVESTEYDDKYTTPVLTPGKSFILGYTKETKGVFTNIPTIIFDDFTTESKYVDFVFKVKSSAMKILNCSNLINIKFIYYLLQVINIDTTTHKRHWLSNYEYMIIPIPCKKIQDKIVNRLESLFDRVNEIDDHYNRIDRLKSVLKSKIIDLAIKGELTKQLSTDEPSSKLIENIIEEKHKLMAEGKIKKENLSIIYKDSDNQFYEKFDDGKSINITNSIPFKLPENWRWTRLNALLSVKGGKRIPKGSSFSKNITKHIYIRVSDMKNNTITKQDIKYISDDIFDKIKNYTISKKDLYLTIAGTIGKVGIVPDFFDNMNLTENAVKLTNIEPIEKKYLMYCINSDFVQSQFTDKTTQVAQPKLAIKRIETTLIPLPPLEEQKRMVFQLQQLLNIL